LLQSSFQELPVAATGGFNDRAPAEADALQFAGYVYDALSLISMPAVIIIVVVSWSCRGHVTVTRFETGALKIQAAERRPA
jgi:hypothetical protein